MAVAVQVQWLGPIVVEEADMWRVGEAGELTLYVRSEKYPEVPHTVVMTLAPGQWAGVEYNEEDADG